VPACGFSMEPSGHPWAAFSINRTEQVEKLNPDEKVNTMWR
jgi:hypothetical protein